MIPLVLVASEYSSYWPGIDPVQGGIPGYTSVNCYPTAIFMCPKCGSNVLLVKQLEGFEKFLAGITGKRTYRCRMCATSFRAPDRRKRQRLAARQAAASHSEEVH
jgi:hypothetical protein